MITPSNIGTVVALQPPINPAQEVQNDNAAQEERIDERSSCCDYLCQNPLANFSNMLNYCVDCFLVSCEVGEIYPGSIIAIEIPM